MATPAIGAVDALAVDQDLAAVDRQQAVDAAQQGGLAAARRADNGDDFARSDLEIDVAEHFERAVTFAQATNADAGGGGLRRGIRFAVQGDNIGHGWGRYSAARVAGFT